MPKIAQSDKKSIESGSRIPSIYDGDLTDEETLLDWLVEQKTTETIEKVTEKILEMLVEEEEYLAVFFRVVRQDFTLECEIKWREKVVQLKTVQTSYQIDPFPV